MNRLLAFVVLSAQGWAVTPSPDGADSLCSGRRHLLASVSCGYSFLLRLRLFFDRFFGRFFLNRFLLRLHRDLFFHRLRFTLLFLFQVNCGIDCVPVAGFQCFFGFFKTHPEGVNKLFY